MHYSSMDESTETYIIRTPSKNIKVQVFINIVTKLYVVQHVNLVLPFAFPLRSLWLIPVS